MDVKQNVSTHQQRVLTFVYGQNVDDLVKYQMDTFGYSEDVAREEVVANSAATVLTDEEFVRNLYNNEHSLFEQIRKFFKELAETFKQLTQSASWSQDAALTPENVRAIAEVFGRVASETENWSQEDFTMYSRLDPDAVADIDTGENINSVSQMKSVDTLNGNEFRMGVKGELVKAVTEYFASIGNKVENPEIGTVWLNKSGIKSDIGHGLGPEKAASFKAVPAVIKNGKVVDIQFNWKQRGYDTVLIAAPVDIRDDRYYMGVVVLKSSESDRFYAHEVWGIKKDGAPAFWTGLPASSQVGTGAGTPPINSILQRIAGVNTDASDVVKFSAKDPVEKKGTLLAIHNLTEEKLQKFLALSGAPMPSIAVTRSDVGHSNFGDISLIFDKSTIDPKASRKNTVYSADAWTPTFPRIEYETNKKVDNAVYSRLTALSRNMDEFYREDLKRVLYGVDDGLNRYGGEAGFVEHAMDNLGLQTATKRKKHSEISECFPFFVFSPRAP